tara:strand:+ start:205 stop:387 length:183 start_codon:yes stop_codon:yes gene_type:complete
MVGLAAVGRAVVQVDQEHQAKETMEALMLTVAEVAVLARLAAGIRRVLGLQHQSQGHLLL